MIWQQALSEKCTGQPQFRHTKPLLYAFLLNFLFVSPHPFPLNVLSEILHCPTSCSWISQIVMFFVFLLHISINFKLFLFNSAPAVSWWINSYPITSSPFNIDPSLQWKISWPHALNKMLSTYIYILAKRDEPDQETQHIEFLSLFWVSHG